MTVGWILSQFHTDPARAAHAYRKFVSQGQGVNLWDELRGGMFLGADAFIEKLGLYLNDWTSVTEILRKERLAGRPSLEKLFAVGQDKATRNEQIYQAVYVHGYTLNEIANYLGLYYSTPSVIANRLAQAKKHQE